eukprot:TRINITY_DN8205_c0_g1_i1.p1 TRINITY_DN8205_c0_g1~~TRINITY_DN8205_c0_g1_i1.p1  ORF type:complete len:645 (+),score=174.83 TRINITY_DN8205_c0_g1_i1:60-1937(+)
MEDKLWKPPPALFTEDGRRRPELVAAHSPSSVKVQMKHTFLHFSEESETTEGLAPEYRPRSSSDAVVGRRVPTSVGSPLLMPVDKVASRSIMMMSGLSADASSWHMPPAMAACGAGDEGSSCDRGYPAPMTPSPMPSPSMHPCMHELGDSCIGLPPPMSLTPGYGEWTDANGMITFDPTAEGLEMQLQEYSEHLGAGGDGDWAPSAGGMCWDPAGLVLAAGCWDTTGMVAGYQHGFENQEQPGDEAWQLGNWTEDGTWGWHGHMDDPAASLAWEQPNDGSTVAGFMDPDAKPFPDPSTSIGNPQPAAAPTNGTSLTAMPEEEEKEEEEGEERKNKEEEEEDRNERQDKEERDEKRRKRKKKKKDEEEKWEKEEKREREPKWERKDRWEKVEKEKEHPTGTETAVGKPVETEDPEDESGGPWERQRQSRSRHRQQQQQPLEQQPRQQQQEQQQQQQQQAEPEQEEEQDDQEQQGTEDTTEYTTVMLRNIPNKYSRDKLIDQLNEEWNCEFDFVYLPIDFKNKCNVGYCFVNFRTSSACRQFVGKYHGVEVRHCLPGFNSKKVVEVTMARVQGLQENVKRLRNSPVMRELQNHPDWMPVIIGENGDYGVFPQPNQSVPIVKPRKRHA